MGLDAVPLFVIVGEVEQFKGEVCPHSMHSLTVQLTYVHHLILECQHMSCVHILQVIGMKQINSCLQASADVGNLTNLFNVFSKREEMLLLG